LPELPEVETVRRGLEQKVSGFYIDRIEVLKERSIASNGGSQAFIAMMKGLRIGRWERRGKYLIASLEKENSTIFNCSEKLDFAGWWCVHLRMTGQFQLLDKSFDPCSHTRVRFWNKKGIELRFVDTRNFGQMWSISPEDSPKDVVSGLNKLGPEPFSKELNSKYLKQKLKGRARSIKASLLDQSIIAGIGNIYADESLFSAGILPYRQSKDIKEYELEKLCKSIIEVLKISIGKGGTTFSDFRNLEGGDGKYGGEAFVYRRHQKACRVCGIKINREKIAGRSSHWCPNCQK
tara:strand:+ start:2347 stop:3222 length:876 start_codon:yes stop_codon:yes gene_type:complete